MTTAFTSSVSTFPPLERLSERVIQARSNGERLLIQGGQSKAFYGETPAPGSQALSLREITGIVSYEPSELVVTVRAGTPLRELEAELASKNQCLPFEPPHFADSGSLAGGEKPVATVGGMVAAGLSGPARASSGAVRDFMLGVSMLNGRGELLQFGGQVMKNVAGYDVSRLMAGSLGALGVIAEVSLKVLPLPVAQATMVFAMTQQAALDALNRWGGQALPLNASVWQNVQGGQLHLRLAGARAAVDYAVKLLAAEVGGQRVDADEARQLWDGMREQRLAALQPAPGLALWRLSVPQTALAVDWPHAPKAPVVEWHGAQRWVLAPIEAGQVLREKALSLGGHATLFRSHPADGGQAALNGISVFQPMTPVLARIHERLRQAFDPDDVFGGGRLASASAALPASGAAEGAAKSRHHERQLA